MHAPMSLHRIVLVDDDPSIRRWVAMALEDLLPELGAELVPCEDAASGLRALRAGPARLLITDLMLPGMSGYALLARLQAEPALSGDALLVACSASLDASARARLAALGVWRQLLKPVPMQVLEDCVREALADARPGPGTAVAHPGGGAGQAPAAAGAAEDAGSEDGAASRAQAIAVHFGGDAGLFEAYRATCGPQFREDVQRGDQAVALHDATALRLLAHSLKSVLQCLGQERLAAAARSLEAAALTGADEPCMQRAWAPLRAGLQALADEASPPQSSLPPSGTHEQHPKSDIFHRTK
jgi:CheY-like chemotaxis protein